MSQKFKDLVSFFSYLAVIESLLLFYQTSWRRRKRRLAGNWINLLMEEKADFYQEKWMAEVRSLSFKHPQSSMAVVLIYLTIKTVEDFPGGSVGRNLWLNSWSGKIPHDVGQLIMCTTTSEPMCCNYGSPCIQSLCSARKVATAKEKPAHCNEEQPLLTTARESPCAVASFCPGYIISNNF